MQPDRIESNSGQALATGFFIKEVDAISQFPFRWVPCELHEGSNAAEKKGDFEQAESATVCNIASPGELDKSHARLDGFTGDENVYVLYHLASTGGVEIQTAAVVESPQFVLRLLRRQAVVKRTLESRDARAAQGIRRSPQQPKRLQCVANASEIGMARVVDHSSDSTAAARGEATRERRPSHLLSEDVACSISSPMCAPPLYLASAPLHLTDRLCHRIFHPISPGMTFQELVGAHPETCMLLTLTKLLSSPLAACQSLRAHLVHLAGHQGKRSAGLNGHQQYHRAHQL